MPYVLDGSPSDSELAEAVNYLLSNFSTSVSADPATGQVTVPTGEVTGYLYKYLYVKYADSFDGTLNFSDSPTNRLYYGVRNSDSSTESTNPSDYVWTQVTGGFGTTKTLWYIITGGRQIAFQVATSQPNPGWVVDLGTAIDLDYATTAVSTPANFVVVRVPNDSSAPTTAEVLASIGREPIEGDLCTVNYNSGIYSLQYRYQSGGWVVFQKYITGDLIVANSIVGNNIAANTVSASNMVTGTITAASGIIANAAITNANIQNAAITNAKIGTAEVGTLTIAGNAVTVPSTNQSSTSTAAVTFYLDVAAPVYIVGSFYGAEVSWYTMQIIRDGTVIFQTNGQSSGGVNPIVPMTISTVDTASAGWHTYSLYGYHTDGNPNNGNGSVISVIAAKR